MPTDAIPTGRFFIENVNTRRYLFQDGPEIKGPKGSEGVWKTDIGFDAPKVQGADANYYNRAMWKIINLGKNKSGDISYFIENVQTKRYLYQMGPKIRGPNRGAEGGWLAHSGYESPRVVGVDSNFFYNRAHWKLIPQGTDSAGRKKYLIENLVTKRYLFQCDAALKGERGAEGGWKASSGFEAPSVVGADANYYNLAQWVLESKD